MVELTFSRLLDASHAGAKWQCHLAPKKTTGRIAASWKKAQRLKDAASDAMVRGDLASAAEDYFKSCSLLRAVNFSVDTPGDHPLLEAKDEGFLRTGRIKLRHDAEQLEYLVERSVLPAKPYGQLARLYRNMLNQLPTHLHSVDVKPFNALFDRSHNRALHLTHPPRVHGPLLSSSFDAAALERRFRDSELPPETTGCEAQNGIAYADGLLAEPVLQALYKWCLESTMWFGARAGYLAAFLQESFNSPLLVQVVEELQRAMPTILGDHKLMNMWAFKYANNVSDWPLNGTEVHADVAAVNVNFWLAPDAANEEADGGGLVVYTKHAPKEWGFADYNGLDAVPRIREYLRDSGYHKVPHRRNRAVIFNSNLFHETQVPRFKPGYSNRRINLTFLFGRRCAGSANEGQGSAFKAEL